ncbi:MAG: immune inhibitor A, partial [Muribaculaceae bacterium]|nr:immune inhibitor A [Muribaculaceae bacterium]
TMESPYTPANVIALNPTSTTEAPAGGTGVWVKGFIVGYMPSSPKTTLDNTVFAANADLKTNIVLGPTADCKDYTQCISVQLPSGSVRTALNLQDNPTLLGAEVMLFGDVMKYCGAPGLKNVSKYDISGQGGTGGGDTPTPSGDTIYSGLVNDCNDWTFDNVTMPDAATYIWAWKEYNGSGYLNASAYVGGAAYASEAYAFTTVDLTGKTDATLTFDHAAKFQTTLRQLCGLVVRVTGSSTWTALNIPTWPEAGAWTFAASGDISLKAYAGKKIEIGFKYGSSASGADTWEIKNFTVKGN